MSTKDTQPTETVDADHAESAPIFVGEYPLCSAGATALQQLPKVGVIEWNSDLAQRVLAAQSDDPPFALIIVDGTADRLLIGPAAASELCERAGLPTLVQDLVADNFEHVGDAVRGVAGVKRESADIDGTRSLSEDAATEYQVLAVNARWTHGTGEGRQVTTENTAYANL